MNPPFANQSSELTEATIRRFKNSCTEIHEQISKVIVGQAEIVESLLLAILAGGHVLVEGVPGLAKTMLVRTFSEILDLTFNRIQFTPDLYPPDILGMSTYVENVEGGRELRFRAGPIFANFILVDEINRASPKAQSALLEAMQERQVTVDGKVRKLPDPFFVLATQNPIEHEGTYPLPEAQLDRFLMKLLVRYPSENELMEIVRRTNASAAVSLRKVVNPTMMREFQALVSEVIVAEDVLSYGTRLVLATQPRSETAIRGVNEYLQLGCSPRGAQALFRAAQAHALVNGRSFIEFADIESVALPILRHRLLLNFRAEAEGITTDDIVRRVLKEVPQDRKASL